jgi:hypothetical protein
MATIPRKILNKLAKTRDKVQFNQPSIFLAKNLKPNKKIRRFLLFFLSNEDTFRGEKKKRKKRRKIPHAWPKVDGS